MGRVVFAVRLLQSGADRLKEGRNVAGQADAYRHRQLGQVQAEAMQAGVQAILSCRPHGSAMALCTLTLQNPALNRTV